MALKPTLLAVEDKQEMPIQLPSNVPNGLTFKSHLMKKFFQNGRRAGLCAASLLAAATLSFAVHLPLATSAMATDLNVSEADQNEGGRFVRIGLNKSIVVKLPAQARDVIVGNSEIVDAMVRTKDMAYLFAKKPVITPNRPTPTSITIMPTSRPWLVVG